MGKVILYIDVYSLEFFRIFTRNMRKSMNPLPGIWNEPATVPSYCYASPKGENNVGSRPTAHYSLLTANWSFTFSAKERDPETGLSYFGSRYYSSDLSIWLSVDPMSDKYASTSPYAYCRNNPIRLVDPNGMFDNEAKATRARNRAVKRYGEDNYIIGDFDKNTFAGESVNFSLSSPIPNLSIGVSADINDGTPGENIGNNYFATKYRI